MRIKVIVSTCSYEPSQSYGPQTNQTFDAPQPKILEGRTSIRELIFELFCDSRDHPFMGPTSFHRDFQTKVTVQTHQGLPMQKECHVGISIRRLD